MQLIVSSSSEKPEPKLRTEYTTLDLVVFIGSCICIFPYLIICLPDTVWKEACPVSRSYRWQTPADGTRKSWGARRAVEACRKWLIKDVHHLCFPGGFQRCWIHSSVTSLPAEIIASISHMKNIFLFSALQTDPSSQCMVPSSSLFQSDLFNLVTHCKISWPSIDTNDLFCLHVPKCDFDYITVPATLNPSHLAANFK